MPEDNTNGRWPRPEALLSEWLAQIEPGREYTIRDFCAITGAGAPSTLRTIIFRNEVPENARPTASEGNFRSWTYHAARAFLKFLAQQVHLRDAFGKPMITARQAAEILDVSYDAFKQGVYRGLYPPAVIPGRGPVPGLWSEDDLRAVLAGTYQSPKQLREVTEVTEAEA